MHSHKNTNLSVNTDLSYVSFFNGVELDSCARMLSSSLVVSLSSSSSLAVPGVSVEKVEYLRGRYRKTDRGNEVFP